jgi:hypothetical protein
MTSTLDHVTLWLQEAQAIAAVATTIGVLIALYVAVIREPRKAAEERRHHEERMDKLHRAYRERVAAQARKVVPSCMRTPMFGDSWWTFRIDNTSPAVTTLLAVDVEAIDAKGIEVPGGSMQANNTMPVDQAFDRSVLAALSGFRRSPLSKQALRDALFGHFVTEWQRTLPPYRHTVMAYTTTKPEYTLRVTIDYEDEAGYQWRRTDTGQPRRTDQEPFMPVTPPAH